MDEQTKFKTTYNFKLREQLIWFLLAMLDASICFVCPVHQTPMEYKVRFWGSLALGHLLPTSLLQTESQKGTRSLSWFRDVAIPMCCRGQSASRLYGLCELWTPFFVLSVLRLYHAYIHVKESWSFILSVPFNHEAEAWRSVSWTDVGVRSKISQDDMTARPVEQWQSYPFVRSTLDRCRNWRVQTSIHKF